MRRFKAPTASALFGTLAAGQGHSARSKGVFERVLGVRVIAGSRGEEGTVHPSQVRAISARPHLGIGGAVHHMAGNVRCVEAPARNRVAVGRISTSP